MYDPMVGTFLSEDSEGFEAGDPNFYRFVGNDPTNSTDPDGRMAIPAVDRSAVLDRLTWKQAGEQIRPILKELPKGPALRQHIWLGRVNERRERMGLPPLESPDELDEDEPWREAGSDAVILHMLRTRPESADLLRRARMVGLEIRSDNDTFWKNWSDLQLEGLKPVVILAETQGGWFRKRTHLTVGEVAGELHKRLEEAVQKNVVSEWFGRVGEKLTANIRQGFKAAGMERELADYEALVEEFEVSVSVASNRVYEVAKEELQTRPAMAGVTFVAGAALVQAAKAVKKVVDAAKRGYWKSYLQKLGKDALGKPYPGPTYPGTTFPTHAHHIVMRKGLGKEGKKAVKESQALLRKYDIDPYKSQENLIWGPNWGHPDQYAKDVLAALKQADKETGTKKAIINALKDLGKRYTEGDWRPR